MSTVKRTATFALQTLLLLLLCAACSAAPDKENAEGLEGTWYVVYADTLAANKNKTSQEATELIGSELGICLHFNLEGHSVTVTLPELPQTPQEMKVFAFDAVKVDSNGCALLLGDEPLMLAALAGENRALLLYKGWQVVLNRARPGEEISKLAGIWRVTESEGSDLEAGQYAKIDPNYGRLLAFSKNRMESRLLTPFRAPDGQSGGWILSRLREERAFCAAPQGNTLLFTGLDGKLVLQKADPEPELLEINGLWQVENSTLSANRESEASYFRSGRILIVSELPGLCWLGAPGETQPYTRDAGAPYYQVSRSAPGVLAFKAIDGVSNLTFSKGEDGKATLQIEGLGSFEIRKLNSW